MRVAFLVGRREWKTRTWRLFWLAALEIVFFVTRAPLFVLRLKLFRPSNHVLAENRGVPVTLAVLSGVGAVGSGSFKKQAAESAGGSKAFLPRVLPPPSSSDARVWVGAWQGFAFTSSEQVSGWCWCCSWYLIVGAPDPREGPVFTVDLEWVINVCYNFGIYPPLT